MHRNLLTVQLSVEELKAIAECALATNDMLASVGPERASPRLTQRVELVTRALAREIDQMHALAQRHSRQDA